MTDPVAYVSALVRLGGGQIVGRTRLQKIAYLLEAMEIGAGELDFEYHNYGPYSAELAFAADDAESLGLIETKEQRGYHSVPYTIFYSTNEAPEFDDDEPVKKREGALNVMNAYSALVLELAATAVYLRSNGYEQNYLEELKKRKPLKANDKRIKNAEELLADLGLS